MLAQTVEELSLSAWPALQQIVYDGWLLRFAGGYTKRANSIVPVYAGTHSHAEKIAHVEALYARRSMPVTFRLTSLGAAGGLDATLAKRGYRKLDKTSVRVMTTSSAPPGSAWGGHDGTVEIAPSPSPEWLAAYAAWQDHDEAKLDAHGAILAAIPHPLGFAMARMDGARMNGAIAALGVVVLQGEWACLTDIITAPEMRRRGLSRRLTLALVAHAQAAGAGGVYLQVVKSNIAALTLYNQLGFDRELYRYAYRVRDQ